MKKGVFTFYNVTFGITKHEEWSICPLQCYCWHHQTWRMKHLPITMLLLASPNMKNEAFVLCNVTFRITRHEERCFSSSLYCYIWHHQTWRVKLSPFTMLPLASPNINNKVFALYMASCAKPVIHVSCFKWLLNVKKMSIIHESASHVFHLYFYTCSSTHVINTYVS